MEQLSGYVERITYQNAENGYTVLQVKCPTVKDLICVVGLFPGISAGETLECQGLWTLHAAYGRQFEAKSYRIQFPSDILGIRKYLGSGLIKGIGPVYANRIVDHFGVDTLSVIDQNPVRLSEIRGLGKKRINLIQECWNDQKIVRDVMVFLQGHGVSCAYAQKIFKTYGKECIRQVQENPYQLARDIFGIGFKMADQIASKLGIGKEDSKRLEAGIEYGLRELSEEGHVCYPQLEFLKIASELLEVDQIKISPCIQELDRQGRIVCFPLIISGASTIFIWFKPLFNAEVGIAHELERIKRAPCSLRPVNIERAVLWAQETLAIQLASAQSSAVAKSLDEKLLIITGGPGTGKSTITQAILKISEKLTGRILLAAPTGKAAKRMTEITGKNASTIHTLLEMDFKTGGFKRKKDNPLECDLLIVDEASMIDTLLMHSLLKALPSTARLLFVGDIYQLPSVGPGTVLLDMIRSLQIPVVTLTEIFRQAQGSQIIVNAHKINEGRFPDIHNKPDSDFFFVEAEAAEDVLKHIVKLVAQRLPQKYGFHAIKEIQVLAPMRKGIVGIENLNAVLQEQLNPQAESLFRAGRKFQMHDKVMQIRNNYKKMVFNGDVGKVAHIDYDEQTVSVLFDELEVQYEFSELDELVLAYAVSVHKFQGSECPCIVMPVHTTHFKLLHRNLLYTGVTRGKKLVVLVGTKQALALAVKNDEVKQRHTGLKQALLGIIK